MRTRILLFCVLSALVLAGCSLQDVVERGQSCPPRFFVDDDGNLVEISFDADGTMTSKRYDGNHKVTHADGEYRDRDGRRILPYGDFARAYGNSPEHGKWRELSAIQGVCNSHEECRNSQKYRDFIDHNDCPPDYPLCAIDEQGSRFVCKKDVVRDVVKVMCTSSEDCLHFAGYAGYKAADCIDDKCQASECQEGYLLKDGRCEKQVILCTENSTSCSGKNELVICVIGQKERRVVCG